MKLGVIFALVASLIQPAAFAQSAGTYPTRPVRIIVGYGAGGTGDVSTRIVAQKLSERLGQQFIIENRPGAGGVVAAKALAAAPADGYTLLMVASGVAVAAALFKSLPYDPVKDFDMISQMSDFGYVLAVGKNSNVQTVKDFVGAAKQNPGKLNIGTISVGSGQYLTAEYFKSTAGIDAVTVPFKGSPDVVAAVKSHNVDAAFETVTPLIGMIKSGDLRAVAVTSATRFPGLPNVPTVRESGYPGYEVSVWNGLAAPSGTPRAVVERLNREINVVLGMGDVQQKFLDLGIVARGSTPERLKELMATEITRWDKVITTSKIEKQ